MPTKDDDNSDDDGGVSSTVLLRHLEEAMELVPAKSAFLQAKQLGIIRRESNPLYFLQCENHNVWKAAVRLATYWEERLRIFQDRAYYKLLDLSGNGAMDTKDIQLLKTGMLVHITSDSKGRSVLLEDRSRLTQEQYQDTVRKMRVLFYVLSSTAHVPANRMSGIIVMPLVQGGFLLQTLLTCNHPQGRLASILSCNALPVRLFRLHVICLTTFTLDLYVSKLLQLFRLYFSGSEKELCMAQSLCEVRQELEGYGIRVQAFPEVMGGNFSYESFSRFIEEQQQQQQQLSRKTLKNDLSSPRLHVLSTVAGQFLEQESSKGSKRSEEASLSLPAEATTPRKCHTKLASETEKDEKSKNPWNNSLQAVDNVGLSSTCLPQQKPKKSKASEMTLGPRCQSHQELSRLRTPEKADGLSMALQKHPQLVQEESDPTWFLESQGMGQLSKYWDARVRLFGERAFFPMANEKPSECALSCSDIAIFQAGHVQLPPVDKRGRSVVFCDVSQSSASISTSDQLLRCLFCVLTLLMRNQVSRKDGIVLLLVVKAVSDWHTFLAPCLSRLRNVFPVNYATVQVFAKPSVLRSSEFQKVVVPSIDALLEDSAGSLRVYDVLETRKNIKSLSSCGLSACKVPEAIGGKWKTQQHKDGGVSAANDAVNGAAKASRRPFHFDFSC